ncbi:MAG TPA: hypothetical protein VKU94_00235, partial [Geobacterales bacterium]|nr:hypothetical protein [Geobacterales bacterium]
MKTALLFVILILTLVFFFPIAKAQVSTSNPKQDLRNDYGFPVANTRLAYKTLVSAQQAPIPNWDEQIGITFDFSSTELEWNVTAIAQSDSYGYGLAYLLNGLTDQGWWYQVGIAYNWPYANGGYTPGFYMIYEVFNSTGSSVFPQEGAGLASFSANVNSNDTIRLSLYFSNGYVYLTAFDYNTGALASASYIAHGYKFLGFKDGNYFIANSNGFFTGLMTEKYYVNPNYDNLIPVFYTSKNILMNEVWLWIDEFNVSNKQLLFSSNKHVYFELHDIFYNLYSNGMDQFISIRSSKEAIYITGSEGISVVNISYEGGFQSPKMTVNQNQKIWSFYINQTPYGMIFIRGSTWTVDNVLNFLNYVERFATDQTTGVFNMSYENLVIHYYHQFKVNFLATITGGGQLEIPIHYISFGKQKIGYFNMTEWVDANTNVQIITYFQEDDNIYSTNESGSYFINESMTINVHFFHQVRVTIYYNTSDGSSLPYVPSILYYSFGVQKPATNDSVIWVDVGSKIY